MLLPLSRPLLAHKKFTTGAVLPVMSGKTWTANAGVMRAGRLLPPLPVVTVLWLPLPRLQQLLLRLLQLLLLLPLPQLQ